MNWIRNLEKIIFIDALRRLHWSTHTTEYLCLLNCMRSNERTTKCDVSANANSNNRSGKYLHALKTNFYLFSFCMLFVLTSFRIASNDNNQRQRRQKNGQKKYNRNETKVVDSIAVTIIVCNHVREMHFIFKNLNSTPKSSAFSQPSTSNTNSVCSFIPFILSNSCIYQRHDTTLNELNWRKRKRKKRTHSTRTSYNRKRFVERRL